MKSGNPCPGMERSHEMQGTPGAITPHSATPQEPKASRRVAGKFINPYVGATVFEPQDRWQCVLLK